MVRIDLNGKGAMLSRPDDYSMSAFDVIYLMITAANRCSLVLQTCG